MLRVFLQMLGARPFDRSLMTPINATDMQHCSPQHKSYITSPSVHLRTPNSFAVKSPYVKHPSDSPNKQSIAATNDNKMFNMEEYNCSLANVSNVVSGNVVRSQLVEGKFHDNSQRADDAMSMSRGGMNVSGMIVNSSTPTRLAEQEFVPAREAHISGNYVPFGGNGTISASTHADGHREILNNIAPYNLVHSEAQDIEAASIAESMLADALLPPSAIHANDIIGSTLDEKRLMYIREKLADKYNALENPVLHVASKSSRPLDASDLLSHSRGNSLKEINDPAGVTKDAERATVMKNPMGSFAERAEPGNAMGASLEAERKTCKPLSHVIQSTVVPVGLDEQRHCSQPLTHKATADKVLGVRPGASLAMDLSATENVPEPLNRCKPADTVISGPSPFSQSIGSQYPVSVPLHTELSSSHVQPTVLHSERLNNQVFPHNVVGAVNETAQQHVEHLKNAMEGLRIDSSTRAQKCRKCREDIRVNDIIVIAEKANDASWHPGCFACSVCNELLVDLVYFYYKNELYCERDLSAHLGIPRCFACDEVIKREFFFICAKRLKTIVR